MSPGKTQQLIEERLLCSSPIACTAADVWFANTSQDPAAKLARLVVALESDCLRDEMVAALDALELVTRNSPLRKVKP